MRVYLTRNAYPRVLTSACVVLPSWVCMSKSALDNDTADTDDGPDPVDVYVGQRLKQRRSLIGMSQEQMGKALGLTFQQIQKYERAANRISASRLHEMAAVLGVATSWFFDGAPKASLTRYGFSDNKQAEFESLPSTLPDSDILQKRDVLELVRAYDSIDDKKLRKTALDVIKSMATKGQE